MHVEYGVNPQLPEVFSIPRLQEGGPMVIHVKTALSIIKLIQNLTTMQRLPF